MFEEGDQSEDKQQMQTTKSKQKRPAFRRATVVETEVFVLIFAYVENVFIFFVERRAKGRACVDGWEEKRVRSSGER